MECNRDEATRAMKIAEEKFAAKDIPGAKKFALKAQNLYPGLEGLPQTLAAFDVHFSAMKRIFGEMDWYGILGVNPEANEETVRKQYRKLALMLHPDKNKSVGADGAFKMISEAWSIVGDKSKRIQYDKRTIRKISQQKVSSACQGQSAPPAGNSFPNFSNIASSSIRAQSSVVSPGMRKSQQKLSSAGPSHQPGGNGFHNFSNTASSSIRAQNNVACPGNSTAAAQQPVLNTFWTRCSKCNMQYEYLRIYLNQNLLCPSCRNPFKAQETAPPAGFIPNPHSPSFHQHQNTNQHPHQHQNTNQHPHQHQKTKQHPSNKNKGYAGFTSNSSFNPTNLQWSPLSNMDGPAHANTSVSVATQAASGVQQTMEKVKKDRAEAEAATRRLNASWKKTRGSKRAASYISPGISTCSKSDNMETPGKKRSVSGEYKSNLGANIPPEAVKTAGEPNSRKELTQMELRNMLAEKARKELRNKLKEWALTDVAKAAEREKGTKAAEREKGTKAAEREKGTKAAEREKGKEKNVINVREKEVVAVNSVSSSHPRLIGSVDAKKLDKDKKETPVVCDASLNVEAPEPMLMSVPDPDFHDFDKDRAESSFGENQVWAVYDDDDGMPRYYALIHHVISRRPFKMKVSWLNSKTNSELGPLNWVGSGFAKTSGDFRVGRHEINNSLNSFSHSVKWTKEARGAVRIFPRKNDVWALYRNWSPDWNELTPDEVIHKYDMVEVLDDFNEEQGVNVVPLVKVAGFKTVFHRHLDVTQVRNIPREEMFRLSHQVPSCLLTGSEGRNAPKGCRELDPAATPLELLQIITETKGAEMLEPAGEQERSEADVVLVDAEGKTGKPDGGRCGREEMTSTNVRKDDSEL